MSRRSVLLSFPAFNASRQASSFLPTASSPTAWYCLIILVMRFCKRSEPRFIPRMDLAFCCKVCCFIVLSISASGASIFCFLANLLTAMSLFGLLCDRRYGLSSEMIAEEFFKMLLELPFPICLSWCPAKLEGRGSQRSPEKLNRPVHATHPWLHSGLLT
ncbi:hypothetical protein KC333_g200 [Hortaea werneckii]|nr:hypothetical protein KC333_g200 [Hortaea werneckii]